MKKFIKKSISNVLQKVAWIPSESTSWVVFCEPKLPKELRKSEDGFFTKVQKKEK